MASLTTTTSSPAALPAASTTAPASSVSPAATKRPHLAGDDAPGRAAATGSAGIRPVQDDSSAYALAVMKHLDPIGEWLVMDAVAEVAEPECIVPGQQAPLRLLGLKMDMREFLNAPNGASQPAVAVNGRQKSGSPQSPLGGKTVS